MSILSGYGKFKRYVLTDSGYKLCSQWTSSNTVHFDDDKTAQTKLGAIDGITDSLTATSSNVALSSKAGNNLQSQINELNTGLIIKTVPITPISSIPISFVAKQMGKLVTLNIQTSWLQWNNASDILLAWIGMEPIAYISREVIFINGDGRVIGNGNVNISNTNIMIQTPIDWVNGTYAHVFATIAFYVS